MSTLKTLSSEVIAMIYESCDSFSEIHNLSLTCRAIRAPLVINQRSIVWHVGQAILPGFSDAVIAVRATEIAKASLLRKELPPTAFPIDELSGEARKPSLAELRTIRDLAALASRAARNTIRSYRQTTWTLLCLSLTSPGAILSGVYFEPLVLEARPPKFLKTFLKFSNRLNPKSWFLKRDQKYIQSQSLHNIQRRAEWSSHFGALETVFVEESRKLALARVASTSSDDNPPFDSDRSTYATYGAQARDLRSLGAPHAEILFNQVLHFVHTTETNPLYDICEVNVMKSKRKPFAGIIEQLVFPPLTVDDVEPPTTTPTATATGPPTSRNEYLRFARMERLLITIWQGSGVPNSYGPSPSASASHPLVTIPPQHFFAEHMFRKYFGLCFADTAMAAPEMEVNGNRGAMEGIRG
ncbi:hypothetical protein BJY00DRAFT_318403 [Aspergillus carlsbadensis]|nr:hypothetical protein BJY00DRAFT_318403 [Aspergillus carlsbadensis]